MRKIAHLNIDKNLILDKKIVHQIVIENKREFYNFIKTLNNQIDFKEEGNFRLSKDNKSIPLYRFVDVITDLFSFELNNRKTKNILIKHISEEINISQVKQKYAELVTDINRFLIEIKNLVDVEIDYDEDIDIKDFLKSVKLVPKMNDEEMMVSLLDYIAFLTNLMGIDIFILINASTILSKDNLLSLINETQLMEVNLILLENRYIECESDDIETIIIDEDLCEIYR